MNLSYFISKRISGKDTKSFSGMIHKIAIASIGIGLAIMIISFLILKGFQLNIQQKIISFGGHLQVTKFTLSQSYEEDPISKELALFQDYSEYPYIDHIQEYANKAGLLKANEEVEGVVLKGVSSTFDLQNFKPNIIKGEFPDLKVPSTSLDIMISQNIADKLSLAPGDDALLYFIQNPPRARKIHVCGIYETGMEDFDDKIVLGDIRLVQDINNWPDSLVGGFEIFLSDFNNIDYYEAVLEDVVGYELYIEKISDKFAEIFDWLALLNRNVVIFLSLTLFVACFNMVSILLILIMERTQMIGVFKALGATNKIIRKIFVYNGMRLIGKGLLLGNAVGIAFGVIQSKFQLFTLDPKSYYMEFVPISWDWPTIVLLNVLTFVMISLVLTVPTMIISKVSPIKSIRFD
ncbi:MAG: ABC transporter permease [Cyclobacteriaceae bacterium]|nr:ABC transporter permease [Cyclobacteriaceae bacterium]